MSFQLGIVGLGVMGSSLALNVVRNGFSVAGYDTQEERVRTLLAGAPSDRIASAQSPEALAGVLERPRRILVMVPAGRPVDVVIETLVPFLQAGDILIDGGNTWFLDTERRAKALEEQDLLYVGMGISGGEEGALYGPSIMPGGAPGAWEAVAPVFSAIAARAHDGVPCVDYMGPGGAGHYVKMIHNGIEYGDLQIIAEAYDVLHRGLGLGAAELSDLFATWNKGVLESYLIGIAARVLAVRDSESGEPLVELILDQAEQKGTGRWTVGNALDIGVPTPTINAAVESRFLSSLKKERVSASRLLEGAGGRYAGSPERLIEACHDAVYASRITTYAQGFAQMRAASQQYRYELRLHTIARIWRAGCIIRTGLLQEIMAAFERQPALANLMIDESLRDAMGSRQESWRFFVQTAVGLGIPVAAIAASLAYYDAYRSELLPANLTQAQRDYFGAHLYRRVDREGLFHTDWTALDS
jgi:6-phosphogluconate dehydrogenase